MLTVDPQLVTDAQQAQTVADVTPLVQAAIQLEHATIPPYLTAWLTLPPGENEAVAEILRSVFLDEMLHMGMMANLLIAMGGEPKFANAAFVPKYPDQLPFGIGDNLTVNLRKCDLEQVRLFIAIERPEHPLVIPEAEDIGASAETFETIGSFYEALREAILRLGPSAFSDPRLDRQVETQFESSGLRPIANADDAVAAIDLIRLQGEGAATPFSSGEVAAHYYAFEQIEKGKKLRQGDEGPIFGPDPLTFDPALVIDMEENVVPEAYAIGSAARAALDIFMARYSKMLKKLELAFTGNPDTIFAAQVAMRAMVGAGRDVLKLDSPNVPGRKAGLAYRYVHQQEPVQ